SRPRLRLRGCRFARASYTVATIASSVSTSSACFIHASPRSPTSSAISPSPKLSCARRILIMPLAPCLTRSGGTQKLVIELANRLDRRFELLIVVQPAANLGHPLPAHAELPRAATGIAHRQHRDGM